jgi:hypothetical protein
MVPFCVATFANNALRCGAGGDVAYVELETECVRPVS